MSAWLAHQKFSAVIEGDYTVIGTCDSGQGTGGGERSLLSCYMPYSTFSTRISGNKAISEIYGYAREGADMKTLAERTKAWLVAWFSIPEGQSEGRIDVMTLSSIIERLDATMASFQVLVTAIAGISLLVGGIGIMNMMLTNVTERIREIGLRKALGARAADIMVLLEIMLKRKSVCKFTKDEISKEQFMKLEELMNYLIAGILTLGIPEGSNMQLFLFRPF